MAKKFISVRDKINARLEQSLPGSILFAHDFFGEASSEARGGGEALTSKKRTGRQRPTLLNRGWGTHYSVLGRFGHDE